MGRPGRVLTAWAFLLALVVSANAEPALPIALTHPPDLTLNIEALPRLIATTPAMERINATLAKLDSEALDHAIDCHSDPPRSFVARWVSVEFAGPRYLGLLTGNEFYCLGAAHGAHFAAPYVFDLDTGLQVDWPRLFPAALQDQENHPHRTDYIIGTHVLTDLYLTYAVAMDEECRDAILAENGGYFLSWPSSADRSLVLMPMGPPYAVEACADPVAIPVATLRSFGFSEDLVSALDDPAPLPRRD